MANTLWEYFNERGQRLPSVQERRQQYGLGSDYVGTAAQNNALLARLQGGGGGGSQPQQRSQPQQQNIPQPPSAEEIMRRVAEERNRKYREQANVWNQFMNEPTFWDSVLARQMSEKYFVPYYKTILEEFVNPLQQRITQSQANEKRLLEELTRQQGTQEAEKKEELQTEIEKAQGGFAGAGVYGGGGARRALARQKISGQRELSDLLGSFGAKKEDVATTEGFEREKLSGEVAQKQRETERAQTGAIEEDVAKQRTQAFKGRAAKAHETISSQFGEFLLNVPDWLQY